MAQVVFELPTLLARFTGGAREVKVEADTLAAALVALTAAHPGLEVHLFDETGAFRQHVLCFVNGENTRFGGTGQEELTDGDRLTILQAVSGG